MKRDRDDDIILSFDEWKVGSGKLGKEFSDTEVAVILKLLNGLTDRLQRSLAILIAGPSARMAEEWRSFAA
jgi:hypothetical protein